MTHRLLPLDNPVRAYDWGSTTSLPALLGHTPSGEPQAEMWLGTHPGDPSIVRASGEGLDRLLADEPELAGGEAHLPFLMKLLAAARPLSLQVHPSIDQAEAGFRREEAFGVPVDDPARSYRDPHPKPEMLVALTPFSALCGFREPSAVAADLVDLLGSSPTTMGADLLAALRLPDASDALRSAFTLILSGRAEVSDLVAVVVERAATASSPAADTVRLLAQTFPGDPGILGALLLHRVDLAPGEALHLDAGVVHSYLAGTGIEAMAPSDNVLRGGLTTKHVDVSGLVEIVAFVPRNPTRVPGETSTVDGVTSTSYWPPTTLFSVHVIEAAHGRRAWPALTGPATLVVTDGEVTVRAGDESIRLGRGDSLFRGSGSALEVEVVSGPARVLLTTTGRTTQAAPDDHGLPPMVAPPRGRDEFGEIPRPPLDPGTRLTIEVGGSGVMRPEDVPHARENPPRETADTIREQFPDAIQTDHQIPGHGGDPIMVSTWRRRGQVGSVPSDSGPGFVWVHGGGMVSGDRFGGLGDALTWMLRYGGTVVSMEYRMPPDVRAPVLSEDCYAALAWVFENAASLGIDPAHVIVGGGSAGGGLAAAMMLLARDRGLPPLFGAMLVCPMLDDRCDTTSVRQIERLSGWNGASNAVCWDAVLGDRRGTDAVSPYDAPARATWLGNLPPVHIDVGSADPFRDEDVAFASAIWRDGGDCELLVVPGGWHGHDWITSETHIARLVHHSRQMWIDRLLNPVDVSGLAPAIRERMGLPAES